MTRKKRRDASEKLKRFLLGIFKTLLVLSWGFAGLSYLGYLSSLISGTSTIEFPWNVLVAVLLFFFTVFLAFGSRKIDEMHACLTISQST